MSSESSQKPTEALSPTDTENTVSDVIQETVEIVGQVSEYGNLIVSSLIMIAAGMFIIFIVHRLTSRLLYPRIENTRIIKVLFGTLYVLILVVAVLIVLRKLGFDVKIISKISILVVLISAVGFFFLVPFLPRLPFKIGHIVEINGVLGRVDGISTYHTTLRKFDGTMAFIPNALVMATKILNYHDSPERRVEISLSISLDSNMAIAEAQLLKIMGENDCVIEKPTAPRVVAQSVDITGIKVKAYCWVKNIDWLATRSELTLQILKEFQQNDQISLSRPQQDIHIMNNT